MEKRIRIDFISDVSCPWCIVGLRSLENALEHLSAEVTADIHFQPFELNPDMPPDGQDVDVHLMEKYGLSREQYEQGNELMSARGAEVGFTFRMDKRSRIFNTFDAHRLLHWAGSEGRQLALKHALFKAYFTEGDDPSDHETLASSAASAGLDPDRAREILSANKYINEVRERERYYRDLGINVVPSIIFNERDLIRGAQSVAMFEKEIRKIARS